MSLSTVFQLAVALCTVAGVDASVLDKRQCSGLQPTYPAPVLSQGWTAQLIANGVRSARGLVFDSNGALLVAQANTGITRITFTESGNCVSVASKTTLATKNDVRTSPQAHQYLKRVSSAMLIITSLLTASR